ncbi:MAG TPA: ankyrin repeat domain-containing protein, partial [Gammaproteobacteria bacterium]|nr:ankyrin repeat domain-containing protein [Gammaproteobacteria bacterium]
MRVRMAGWALGVAAVVAGAAAAADEVTLLDAAEAGNHDAALALLRENPDVNARGPDGATALMWAAYNEDLDLVKALLAHGADLKARNDFGAYALSEAAITGNAPIIAALLSAGADPNAANGEGETPLMEVARAGRVDAAKLLLDAGADVNAKELWGGQSPLMWAAAQSQPAMIELLLAHGAEADARGVVRNWERKVIKEPRPKDMNQGGFTPLLYAAREGCLECAKKLVAGGADLNLPDPHRVTPLVMALLNLHFDLAAYLIEAGADVNKWDLYGRTPLYMAADTSTLPVMGNGAMVVLPSPDKLSALDVAKLLLAKGADPNIQLKRRPPYRNVPQDRGGDTILSQGATPLL